MKKIIHYYIVLLILVSSHVLSSETIPFYFNQLDGPPLFKYKLYQRAIKSLPERGLLLLFKDFMDLNEFPSNNQIQGFIQSVIVHHCHGRRRYLKCLNNKRMDSLYILRQNDYIDNLLYLLIKRQHRNNNHLIDSKDYLRALKSLTSLRNHSAKEVPSDDLSFLNSIKLSQSYLGIKGLTPRQTLYLKYNSFQIKYLAKMLKDTLDIMNSPMAYIYIQINDSSEDDIRIDLSYSEKYRLSIKLLNHKMNELLYDTRFGIKPRYIDILSAAVETGIISINDLKIFYMMPEFIDSYRNRFRIYGDMLKNFAKYAITNTPIVGQISIIPILLMELRQEMKENRNQGSNETHIF